jgi:hypothetical protein
MKIGILIPSTSNGRAWNTFQETYLYQYTLKSFFLTYDKEHEYVFYIGIDRGDRIYDNPDVMQQFRRFLTIAPGAKIEFIYMDGIKKGHLTKMWNVLFKKAYDEGCQYFYQCGDDIKFHTKGWVNSSIKLLEHKPDRLGMTGPANNNPHILTQSFVSRKHMELFGYYFPEEIVNWYCDDWINEVYKGLDHFFPLLMHFCENLGGTPRYHINNDSNFHRQYVEKRKALRAQCTEIVNRDLARCAHIKS